MAKQVFDVCVMGSGPGGCIATYVLAKAGLEVALVEAGAAARRPRLQRARLSLRAPRRASESGASRPPPSILDYSERDHYSPVGDRPGQGLFKAVGARSLCWAGHSLRFGPGDFKSWPISYDEVAPYYSRAERADVRLRQQGTASPSTMVMDSSYLLI